MSFRSEFAPRIWDRLYTVLIPDALTLDKSYLKIFGNRVTNNKEVDDMVLSNFTTVKITVAKILEYYVQGLEIQIPSREDMLQIHKDIELYLGEWREHLRVDINLNADESKDLLLSLERLSKDIYNKAKPKEVVTNLLLEKRLGLINPFQEQVESNKQVEKADYEGIGSLVRSKTIKPKGRF